jgi:DNA (cytosine-5)-methyltransferase 1
MQTTTKKREPPIAGLVWVKKRTWPPSPPPHSKPLTLVDLFCSCGGMTLGCWEGARLQNRRLDVRLAIDLMHDPLRVYARNFAAIASDIRQEDVSQLFDGNLGQQSTAKERDCMKRIGPLDLLVAGPPCQGHSDLNNSTRRKDPRNALYLRVARAAQVLKPKAIIIENVPAVLHDESNVVGETQRHLSRHYTVSEKIVEFSRFGVPQNRKRHILLAVRSNPFVLGHLDDVNRPKRALSDYLSGTIPTANPSALMSMPARLSPQNAERVKYLFDNNLHNLPNALRPPCHRDKKHAYVSMYGRMYWDRPAQTITSGFGSMGQGRYIHPNEPRLITPHEAARIQGIPDFFDFSSVPTFSSLREMIANAVPPQFTATLVARLIEHRVL